jgi:peptide/nickel transport system permease protein
MQGTSEERQQDLLLQGLVAVEQTYLQIVLRRFRRHRLAIVGVIILTLLILMSVLAPVITHYGRDEIDIQYIYAKPDYYHWLGTDHVGRDVVTRIVYGGRVSLTLAATCVLIYMVVGSFLGAVAGYVGGWLDNLIMRLADIIISFPFILFVLTIVALRGPAISNLIFAICFLLWPFPARLVRGEFLSIRERDYVEAARAVGSPPWRIMLRHMMPNAMAPLIVSATLDMATVILLEAGLSYLGFGVREPVPTWGNMLTEANNVSVLTGKPWLWIPPGLMIFLTVLSINFVGDGLRDALDPKLKQ